MELNELKEWLKIDGEDEDTTLSSLLLSSRAIIKKSVGVTLEDLKSDKEAVELYKTVQKVIIAELYENRGQSAKINQILISLSTQLGAYRNGISK